MNWLQRHSAKAVLAIGLLPLAFTAVLVSAAALRTRQLNSQTVTPHYNCSIGRKMMGGLVMGPQRQRVPFLLVTFKRDIRDSVYIPDDPLDALVCSRLPTDTLHTERGGIGS